MYNFDIIAEQVYRDVNHQPKRDEIDKLVKSLITIHSYKMDALIDRLISDKRNIIPTITEINFVSDIIKNLENVDFEIFYEDEQDSGAPDFKIIVGNRTFWFQVKSLQVMKFYNIQRKIVREIEKRASRIKINKFYTLGLADTVCFEDIDDFILCFEQAAHEDIDKVPFYYPNEDEVKVKFSFWKPNKSNFGYLTLGSTIGLEARCVSEEVDEHLRGCFTKASKAITWNSDENVINIIAVEANNYDDLDIGEVLFGTEQFIYPEEKWQRCSNGKFYRSDFGSKFAFVVVLRSENDELIGEYQKNLFVNQQYRDKTDILTNILDITKVYFEDTFIE